MPIPIPRKGETKEAFISRCMGNPTMVKEYPQDQRYVICNNKWRERGKHSESSNSLINVGSNEGIVILSAGHSLIMGHAPEKLTLERVHDKLSKEIIKDNMSFGLFDSSQPNYTTYYPDVTAEDLNPKDSDFIFPIFRMLSEVIVNKKTNPVSFKKPGVLKESMALLKGQTVNVDHETAVGNAIGSVIEVEWQEAYKVSGLKVPAGINGKLKIDGKANPRLARGVMMDPPSIHSNSVTIRFEWEQSHPKMSMEEFFSKLGTFDDKGNLIMRVATKINAYAETSLVNHGADPFAQKTVDGKIVNPTWANQIASLSEENTKNNTIYSFYNFKTLTEESFYLPELNK